MWNHIELNAVQNISLKQDESICTMDHRSRSMSTNEPNRVGFLSHRAHLKMETEPISKM